MKFFLPTLMFFLALCSLTAQTAEEMDALLETPALTYAQAARFILPAAGTAEENISTQTAFDTAVSMGWLPETVSPQDPARLDQTALFLMKAFNPSRGGLLYRLFHNARYAYRELIYKQIIQGQVDSSMALSGEEFFQILGRTMEAAETREAKSGEGREE